MADNYRKNIQGGNVIRRRSVEIEAASASLPALHADAMVLVGADGLPLAGPGGGASTSTIVTSSKMEVFDVTLSCFVGAVVDGNIIADLQEITNFFPAAGGKAILFSAGVHDEDDIGIAFDLVFADAAVSLGTEGSMVSATDSVGRSIIATGGPENNLRFTAAGYTDLVAFRRQMKDKIGIVLKGLTTSVWVGAIARSGATTTAAGLRLKLGVAY